MKVSLRLLRYSFFSSLWRTFLNQEKNSSDRNHSAFEGAPITFNYSDNLFRHHPDTRTLQHHFIKFVLKYWCSHLHQKNHWKDCYRTLFLPLSWPTSYGGPVLPGIEILSILVVGPFWYSWCTDLLILFRDIDIFNFLTLTGLEFISQIFLLFFCILSYEIS